MWRYKTAVYMMMHRKSTHDDWMRLLAMEDVDSEMEKLGREGWEAYSTIVRDDPFFFEYVVWFKMYDPDYYDDAR